ncbi:MAG: ribosome maturation factor RimP [Candidatus Rokubacteria bacterium]|nr:ribosome maturation factor RimP [Candidatus Rokubacteria bacterium]
MMDEAERLSKIEEAMEPVLRGHGLDLVDVDWRREGRHHVLRFFVDKPGGATIDDCVRLSREAGDVLDVSGLIPESYDLEVSTPGLDRKLETDREFRWARGKTVRCRVRQPVGGRTEVRGRLVDVAPDHLTVQTESGPVEVPRQWLSKARLEAEVPWPRHVS